MRHTVKSDFTHGVLEGKKRIFYSYCSALVDIAQLGVFIRFVKLVCRLKSRTVNQSLVTLGKIFKGLDRTVKKLEVHVVYTVTVGHLGNQTPCDLHFVGVRNFRKTDSAFFNRRNRYLIFDSGIVTSYISVLCSAVLKGIFQHLIVSGYADVVEICRGFCGKTLKGDNDKVVRSSVDNRGQFHLLEYHFW